MKYYGLIICNDTEERLFGPFDTDRCRTEHLDSLSDEDYGQHLSFCLNVGYDCSISIGAYYPGKDQQCAS